LYKLHLRIHTIAIRLQHRNKHRNTPKENTDENKKEEKVKPTTKKKRLYKAFNIYKSFIYDCFFSFLLGVYE